MRRRSAAFALWIAACLVLTSCAQGPRVETIIIEEEPRPVPSAAPSLFEVETIYPVLQQEDADSLGWLDADAVLAVDGGYEDMSRFYRADYPYDSLSELRETNDIFSPENVILSPDGRYIAYIMVGGPGGLSLKLTSMTGEENKLLEVEQLDQKLGGLSWSGNSRYLCFMMRDGDGRELTIGVYDTEDGSIGSYSMDQDLSAYMTAVHISDNGESAAIVKQSDRSSSLEYGRLDNNRFVSEYKHSISSEGQVEWIHPDQIVFTGSDGVLYAYDRRNDAVTVLLRDIGIFRMSQDREYMAFMQENSVYAARLYGNNVVDKKLIYQGIFATRLDWSPDNGKLLLSGAKRLQRAIDGAQHYIIDFK